MAKIAVKICSDQGDLGTHVKFGALVPGATIIIDEEDFGDQLFERPSPDWRSPHEKKDAERAAETGERVGNQDAPAAKTSKEKKEVNAHA